MSSASASRIGAIMRPAGVMLVCCTLCAIASAEIVFSNFAVAVHGVEIIFSRVYLEVISRIIGVRQAFHQLAALVEGDLDAGAIA